MTSSNSAAKRFFLNKRFYLHVRGRANTEKAAELIKVFGGQIDQFLENSVSYVLTDVPKQEWPPLGNDDTLKRARNTNVKLMSLKDLIIWCSQYISSQSSSDEDDESKASVNELNEPFLKFEDLNCYYSPTVKEFVKWPEVNISAHLPVGKSIFSDSGPLTQLPPPTPNHTANHGIRRRHPVFCEICSQKIVDKIEDHVQTPLHKSNTEKMNWSEVNGVIESLPTLSTLNARRPSSLTPKPNISEHQEFLCLHKVESISQLFFSSCVSVKIEKIC